VRRAATLMQNYYVQYWPMFAIGGRYLTSPTQVGQHMRADAHEDEQQEAALKVMDYLVEKSKQPLPVAAK
jgi:thiol:disulfide interchange protein DsbA